MIIRCDIPLFCDSSHLLVKSPHVNPSAEALNQSEGFAIQAPPNNKTYEQCELNPSIIPLKILVKNGIPRSWIIRIPKI